MNEQSNETRIQSSSDGAEGSRSNMTKNLNTAEIRQEWLRDVLE